MHCLLAAYGAAPIEERVSPVQANPNTVTADKPSPARQYTRVRKPQ